MPVMSGLVTFASVLMAFACVVITWRTRQEARRRSQARVAALASLIDPPGRAERAPIATAMPTPLHPLARVAMGFGAVAAGLLAAVLVAALFGRTATPAAGAAPSSSTPPALELLAMSSARQGQMLTVDGAVRNGGGDPVCDVAAEVLLLDRNGRRIASGRAPLSAALGPGTIARFHVAIPGNRAVHRYRVSFRNDAGLVRHVDRRATSAGTTGPPPRGRQQS